MKLFLNLFEFLEATFGFLCPPIKCVNSADCIHSTKASIECWSGALSHSSRSPCHPLEFWVKLPVHDGAKTFSPVFLGVCRQKAMADNHFAPSWCADAILLSADGAPLLSCYYESTSPTQLCSAIMNRAAQLPLPTLLFRCFQASPCCLSWAPTSVKATEDNHFPPLFSYREPNSTASAATLLSYILRPLSKIPRAGAIAMEPDQISPAVLTIVNTSCIIQQYVRYLQNWVRKRRQRDYYSDEDTDTDGMASGDWEIMVLLGQVHAVERRFWARETSTDWWDRIVLRVWDDSQWLKNFCTCRATFMELCDLLSPALKHKDTKMRAALTVEKRVAIALWKLATPNSYLSVGNQFGVGKSTVGAAVLQVAKANIDQLLSRVVTLGNVQTFVDGFNALGFPNCGRVIDGTLIPILAPEHRGVQYIYRKGYFSMVLQALVDHKGRFTDISVGWLGKVHDACIFRNSGLFEQLQEGTYFPDQKITVGDVEMPVVIPRDPAYPIMPWLMKPYTGTLDNSKEQFNYRLSKCKMVIECAFGYLKARWRSLLTRLDLSTTNIPIVIASCCVLHNICESKGETFMAGWRMRQPTWQPVSHSQTTGRLKERSRVRCTSEKL
ncbi:unnamed protein product [Lepidochelys kempii]